MEQRRIFHIVVASPSDVKAERQCLDEVVKELNGTLAEPLGVVVELRKWETDARPGFHVNGPQGLIDEVLKIESCDAFIGIFWKRFGTPVYDGDSGTMHEFRKAYEAWKSSEHRRPEILFYFNEKSYCPKHRRKNYFAVEGAMV